MPYSITVALKSLWHERWVNILSVLTIAMGLIVMTLIVLSIYNVDLFSRRLPERFSVVAYLKNGISEQDSQSIIDLIKKHHSVEKIKYISKTEALKELKASMRNADYILEGLDENPLPASIEVRLRREAVSPDSVKAFVSDIRKINGIEDIQYGEGILLSIHSIKTGIQTMGIVLTAIMLAGIIFICYSTVKILFYRRNEEIETLKLLGATRGFIRTPFVIEGGTVGVVGGIISAVALFVFYSSVFYRLSITMPIFRSIAFPSEVYFSLPAAGLFLGITGALIAIGRIKY
ncbi:MAG: permease-like cell division protein FtsX [Thermodesulfovibrionales bacterium]